MAIRLKSPAEIEKMRVAGRVVAHTNVMEKNKIYADALTTRMLRSELPVSHKTVINGEAVIEVSAPVWREEEKEDFLLSAGNAPGPIS